MAIVLQKADVVKVLVERFSVDPYELYYDGEKPCRCIITIFDQAPQSFIIDFLKISGVRVQYLLKVDGFTLLHTAVLTCCFDVVCFIIEECEEMDINATDDNLHTPLHAAYLGGHRQISEFYYIKLKSRLSVCLHFWNAHNSAVSASIETGLARNESCVFEEH